MTICLTRQVAIGAEIGKAGIRVIRGGEKLQAGDFSGDRTALTAFARRSRAGHDRPPAKVTQYKEGGSHAFLIEHRGLRILVHASANFIPGMYRDVRADIVFLAVGGVGRAARVVRTGLLARDGHHHRREADGSDLLGRFLRSLDQPLSPLRRFMDDVPAGLARIDALQRAFGNRGLALFVRRLMRGLDTLGLRVGDLADDLASDRRDVLEITARFGRDPLAADEIVVVCREQRLERGGGDLRPEWPWLNSLFYKVRAPVTGVYAQARQYSGWTEGRRGGGAHDLSRD